MPITTSPIAVDRAAFAVALAERLRTGGLPIGLGQIDTCVKALEHRSTPTRSSLYWATRLSYVLDRDEVEAFDTVFDALFRAGTGDATPPVPSSLRSHTRGWATRTTAPHRTGSGSSPREPGPLPWVERSTSGLSPADGDDETASRAMPSPLPSALAALADTPFDELDPAALTSLEGWLTGITGRWPTRRSRRMAADSAGHAVALRATIAAARRTAWEPLRLVHRRPVRRPRRLLLLCDVSRSMRPYATAYVHMMRAAVRTADAEVFAFATGLTRLTVALDHRSAATAVARAADAIEDRFAGTRIATNVAALLDSHHASAARGAIVVVASDGWDSDPPADLARAMQRLHRAAHRVVWINPRVAAPDYRPLVGAMAAAAPWCDRVLPGHTVAAMRDVAAAIVEAA